jgi:hypothetical protein
MDGKSTQAEKSEKIMSQQIRALQPILYGDGIEVPVELPRNLSIEYIDILPDIVNLTFTAGVKPAYVPSTLIAGVRLTYKGKQFYARSGMEIRELMELNAKIAPVADDWKVAPESRFKGSESNYLYVQFAPIAVCSTGAPTAIQCVVNLIIHIATITFNKINDYRGFFNFGAAGGLYQYQIPADNQSIPYVIVEMDDGLVMGDIDDTQIIIQNIQSGVEIIRDSWYNLRLQFEGKWGYAHNVGVLVIPLGIRQKITESYQIQVILNTPGAAVHVNILVVTQV